MIRLRYFEPLPLLYASFVAAPFFPVGLCLLPFAACSWVTLRGDARGIDLCWRTCGIPWRRWRASASARIVYEESWDEPWDRLLLVDGRRESPAFGPWGGRREAFFLQVKQALADLRAAP